MSLRLTEEQFAALRGRPLASASVQVPALLQRPAPDYSTFVMLCKAAGLPEPEREHRFHPTRRWRLDLAWPAHRLAIECEGGLWSPHAGAHAAHARPLGILRDMEKSNALTLAGWRLLRYTPQQLEGAVAEVAQLITGGMQCRISETPSASRSGSRRAGPSTTSKRRKSGGSRGRN